MEQQMQQSQQQEQPVVQETKKQKSLFWIITTLYLTMILTGLILMIPIALIGVAVLSVFPYAIRAVISFFIPLIAYILALMVGVNYIAKKTIISKLSVVKISLWVAIITIVLYLIIGLFRGFSSWDLLIFPCAVIVYIAAKYFLEKKAV